MFTNPFAKTQQIKVNAPWSNRSKILAGLFAAGLVGSTASVVHDYKQAADDALIPDEAVDAMLAEPATTQTAEPVAVAQF